MNSSITFTEAQTIVRYKVEDYRFEPDSASPFAEICPEMHANAKLDLYRDRHHRVSHSLTDLQQVDRDG